MSLLAHGAQPEPSVRQGDDVFEVPDHQARVGFVHPVRCADRLPDARRPTSDERLPDRVIRDVPPIGWIRGCQVNQRHLRFLISAVVCPLREPAVVDLLQGVLGVGLTIRSQTHALESVAPVDDVVIWDRGVEQENRGDPVAVRNGVGAATRPPKDAPSNTKGPSSPMASSTPSTSATISSGD